MFTLYGSLGSPYSMKIRSALRYRRIPFVWKPIGLADPVLSRVRVPVMPVFAWPDGRLENDSTPLLRSLEAAIPDRGLLPEDPVARFLASLLEDFADEWLTKAMFLARWTQAPPARSLVARWLASDVLPDVADVVLTAAAAAFEARQISRLPVVLGGEAGYGLVRDTLVDVLRVLDGAPPFWFGSRPSVAELAFAGQLGQLASDPEPGDAMRASSPNVVRWLSRSEDWSGVEGQWGPPSAAALALVGLASEIHLPYLAANAAASARGEPELSVTLRGQVLRQPVVRYAVKCLAALASERASLSPAERAQVDALLGPGAAALGYVGDEEAR